MRDASCSEADLDCHFFLWIKAIQLNSEVVWAIIVVMVCLFFKKNYDLRSVNMHCFVVMIFKLPVMKIITLPFHGLVCILCDLATS